MLSHIFCKIYLIWDGATLHFTEKVKVLLRSLQLGRLTLLKLPAHSPELNPDEQVWTYLKQESDLKNFVVKTLQNLELKSGIICMSLSKKLKELKPCFASRMWLGYRDCS